jgi:hypothetical protein
MASRLHELPHEISGAVTVRISFYKYHTHMACLRCDASYVLSDTVAGKISSQNITFIWLFSCEYTYVTSDCINKGSQSYKYHAHMSSPGVNFLMYFQYV